MNAVVPASSLGAGRARDTERPLVTIVVPVRNGGRFLRESLDSILAQTYRPLEVIVLDDDSTDETPELLDSYGEAIRVVRQPEARGIYDNANDGIALARGEYVGVFHADDVYLPTIVEREVELLERYPDAGAAFAFVTFVDVEGREFGRLGPAPAEIPSGVPMDYRMILNGLLHHKNSFMPTPSALVRTEVYRRLGGYRQHEYKNTSDLEMWLRIARHHPVVVLQEPLMRYRRGHGSSSERYHLARTEQERFFTILDLELAGPGAAVAEAAALSAYEAHRSEDLVMRAVSHYVLGSREGARRTLRELRLRALLGSGAVQRGRLALLALSLRLLSRLPRMTPVARAFARRWHGDGMVRQAGQS